MEIWLNQDSNKFRLPVNPASIEITTLNKNVVVEVYKLGEYAFIGKEGLKGITLSSFFPSKNYSFNQYKNILTPLKSVSLIDSYREDPARLIITKLGINMLVTIENFNYSLQDGTSDIYYTLDLKEYRTTAYKKKKIGSSSEKVERTSKKTTNKTYTVKQGDTLYSIAKRETGNFNNWKAIAKINNISDEKKLTVGKKLVIKV